MDLPTELVYEILNYCSPKNYSCICSLWREISKHQQRQSYVEKVIAQLCKTREFVNSCYEDYITISLMW